MSDSDHKPEPDSDDMGPRKRVSFRDYPSTGLVVLAAAVSGLSWLAYKWSSRKRGDTQGAERSPASDHEEATAEPKQKAP